MKFVHVADLHFDSPFTGLTKIQNGSDTRRLEQRNVFKKVIDYCKEKNIDYLWIAGDLYEHEYVRKSTIEYIHHLFEQIKDTKIFIAPGNHDPYIKGSYYETFGWSENVHICKNELECIEDADCNIYMTAFLDFYQNTSAIENIQIKQPHKKNILVTHCDLNGGKDENGFSYHPIPEAKINALGFDYVAMGHIHKTNFSPNQKIMYPGSTISFGFDEIGAHGMVVGEINEQGLHTEFVKLDERTFEKYEFSVDNIASQEDLIEAIANLQFDKKELVEIVLIGNRQFLIRPREILKLVETPNILKIKDNTQIGYDIEKIAKENNLRGIFIRQIIQQYQQGKYTEQQIKKAIEIGLNVME